MKSILLYVNEDDALEARLQAALDIVGAFEGHLTCLQATPYDAFIMGDPFGGIYALPVMIDEIREAEEAHRARIEDKLRRAGASWDWIHCDGHPAQMLVDRSRLADLVVLGVPPKDSRVSGGPLSITADVAVHARALVLAVPAEVKAFDVTGPALVAWNGSTEGAHALRFALPMLQKASKVCVVTVTDDKTGFPATDACLYLSRHGIEAELHEWPRSGRSVGEAIRDAASVLGAAFIIMGAYGHSRMREAVLGGVTRDMLEKSPVPLLLGH